MQELAARRLDQAPRRDARSIFAASELIGARKMIERAVSIARCEPQKSQGAMGVIVRGFERTDAGEAPDGVPRLAECVQGNGAVVVRRHVLRLGRDRIVEMADGGTMLALRR